MMSFVRCRGMWFSKISSTSCPCGSTTVTPWPAAMSREHVPEQGALAGTGPAKDSEMPTARIGHDANRPALVVRVFADADGHGVERHGGIAEIIRRSTAVHQSPAWGQQKNRPSR